LPFGHLQRFSTDFSFIDFWVFSIIATMSDKSTYPGANILDKMRHAGNDLIFDDIIPIPTPTPAKKLLDLPANLDKLSLKALEDLAKQNWVQTNDELALERRLTFEFKAQSRILAECERKKKEIGDRLDSRHGRLEKIADAIGVHEGRDANVSFYIEFLPSTFASTLTRTIRESLCPAPTRTRQDCVATPS
jgi:hypothetical protein